MIYYVATNSGGQQGDEGRNYLSRIREVIADSEAEALEKYSIEFNLSYYFPILVDIKKMKSGYRIKLKELPESIQTTRSFYNR